MHDDTIDTVPCEACDGDAPPLGQLGRLTHYRCSCCGWTFSLRSES